jgi:hypothetical protein
MLLKNEMQEAMVRYSFLVETLNTMNEKVTEALKDDNKWFAIAPRVCKKFLNQAVTLHLLFSNKIVELKQNIQEPFEDLSAIYSTIRMQFETHGLFYHLFIPADDIEENILRFRLWELDGIRSRIMLNTKLSSTSPKLSADQNYIITVENAIKNLHFFNNLNLKTQQNLISKAMWRFTSASLTSQDLKPISFNQLIKNTGIKDFLHVDLYAQLSIHTHPAYAGIMQNSGMDAEELTISKYVALMLAGFVTAFMIHDLGNRFVESRDHLARMTQAEKEILYSLWNGAREKSIKF